MDELLTRAVDVARGAGATYADARWVDLGYERLSVRDDRVEGVRQGESAGVGIRVVADGCWGFAATSHIDPDSLDATARRAVEIARSGRALARAPLALAPVEPVRATWDSSAAIDPFRVPLDDKLGLLLAATAAGRDEPGVTVAEASSAAWRRHSLLITSEGSRIEQRIIQCGGGIEMTAVADGELQNRSYPNSFGGDFGTRGWELVLELDLAAHAPRVAAEAVQLLRAPDCPADLTTLVLDGSQTALQVHESIGHPIELDRVLGMEAAYAGTSFLTPEDVGLLRYGSRALNVVADATTPGALGSFGFDDEGVPATSTPVITDGVFQGFLTSRETAAAAGRGASGGTVRAESWSSLPLIRMTNISLLPGEIGTLEELIDGVDRGVYMETNRSWSIDDRRVDFQFGTEWGREIVDGRLGRVVKNPVYGGRTLDFWGSLDAVGGPGLWRAWGLPNCGKGQPAQVGYVGHGASPARFRGVLVGAR